MKILCDVCGQESASAFCCADEAALCDACDRRVHRANKLAGKHRRFSLSAPSAQSHPLCDICRGKRAFLFCQEDRAILCKDCDESIHSANHLTMKHNRFLLTGVRLSPAPISSSSSTEPESEATPAKDSAKTAVPVSDQNKILMANSSSPTTATTTSCSTTRSSAARPATASTTVSAATTSSISEYLTKMCPGWCVEDLLVDDAGGVSVEDFAKGNELLPFLEPDLDGGAQEPTADDFPVWAAQVPQFPSPYFSPAGLGHRQTWHANKEAGATYQRAAETVSEQGSEDIFMVPQISPAPTPNKRARRSLWHC
ncbi:B-box zinc finger protein 20-like [Zingiber officinale]|uniref:B-box zinc finger protein 20-like n=1 Tax=Zingiber officinale TaxID=94328 RepID=UPI001C4B0B38|nr:B-box zinc finger protein 20-like [Zingiber officinale]